MKFDGLDLLIKYSFIILLEDSTAIVQIMQKSVLLKGMPAAGRGLFEFNGALLHEVFWNVFICQNFIDHGFSAAVSIIMVPIVSCVVHGFTSNFNQGYRCFPQFLWVALNGLCFY